MRMQRASVLVFGLVSVTVSCSEIILGPDGYQLTGPGGSSASSSGEGSGGEETTSTSAPVTGAGSGGAPVGTTTSSSTGAGTSSCDSGYTACGSECVLITSDPKHCGSCDRDCQGQPCEASVCSPRLVASDQPDPGFIALDASGIYWTTRNGGSKGSVRRASLDGSGGVVQIGSSQGSAEGVVVDGGFVYWADNGTMLTSGAIKRAPVAGGAPEVMRDIGATSRYRTTSR